MTRDIESRRDTVTAARANGATCRQIAARLGVHPATVRRDLDARRAAYLAGEWRVIPGRETT